MFDDRMHLFMQSVVRCERSDRLYLTRMIIFIRENYIRILVSDYGIPCTIRIGVTQLIRVRKLTKNTHFRTNVVY